MCTVVVTCLVSPLPLVGLLWLSGERDPVTAVSRAVGVAPACNTSYALLWPTFMICSLFLGPLVCSFLNVLLSVLAAPAGHRAEAARTIIATAVLPFDALISFRNVIFAPVTEEWCFRACVVPLFVLADLKNGWIIAFTCAVFGLAHVHHYFEHRRSGLSHQQALVSVTAQLAYTSLFGAIESYFFLATGSLVGVILPHAFCNWMGMPSLEFAQQGHPCHRLRHFIWLAYAVGIAAFVHLMVEAGYPGTSMAPCSAWAMK